MAEQEEAIAELLRLEKERAERIAKEEKEREEAERKRKLEEYQIKVHMTLCCLCSDIIVLCSVSSSLCGF